MQKELNQTICKVNFKDVIVKEIKKSGSHQYLKVFVQEGDKNIDNFYFRTNNGPQYLNRHVELNFFKKDVTFFITNDNEINLFPIIEKIKKGITPIINICCDLKQLKDQSLYYYNLKSYAFSKKTLKDLELEEITNTKEDLYFEDFDIGN